MKELNRYDLSMLDYAIGTGQEIYMHDDDHLEREVSRIERSLQDMRQQIAPLSVTSNDNITMADLACPENTGLETEEEWKLNGRADLIDMSLVLETDHLYIERNDFVLEFKRGEILRFKAPGRALSSAGSAEQEDNISSIIGNNESNDNNYNLYQMQPTVEILEWLKALANMSLTSSQLDLPEWVTCIRN